MKESFPNGVLVVEDEALLAEMLAIALKHLGLTHRLATTLEAARAEIAAQAPDLVLLDRMLPDGEGLNLCEEIRNNPATKQTLVIILSARGEVSDRIKGLNLGADDYLPKPFDVDELHARIRALARRTSKTAAEESPAQTTDTSSSASQNIPLWTRDSNSFKVLGPKGWVQVTQLEFKLLEKFITQPGKVISRDDLLKDVWGFQWLPKTRTVDFFMGRVRKNFELDADRPRHFITVRGVGYRFEL